MRRLLFAVLVALFCAPTVQAQSYTESFTTTSYDDIVATTAAWDTGAGSIHLPAIDIALQGGIAAASANRVLRMGSIVVVARQGAGVDLVDVSDPSVPVATGSISYGGGPLDPVALDIARSGSVLYVAWSRIVTVFPLVTNYGVDVYSIANPSAPVHVQTVSGLRGDDLCVHGNRLYAIDGSGLSIWDITDTAFPSSLGSVALGGTTRVVVVAGNTAYVGTSISGLHVVDVSHASSPALITTLILSGEISSVAVDGFLLCAAAGSAGLHLVDVNDPFAPSVLSTFASVGGVEGVRIDGDVVALADDSGRLVLVDVTVPSSPVEIASKATGSPMHDVELAGMQLYGVEDDGLGVYRDAAGYPPQRVRATAVGTLPVTRIIPAGDRVYFADGALHVYDNRRTTPFAELGSWGGTMGVNTFDVDGSLAYAVDPQGVFHVLDVSNPLNITSIGTVATGLASMTDVVANGQMVWLLYGGSSSPGLYGVDVSNPAAPVMNGYYNILGEVRDLEVSGPNAYVIAGSGGVRILSIANPSSISLLGTYSLGTILDGALAAQGNLLYVAGGAGGNDEFEVVDVGVPSAPVKLGGTNPIPSGIAYLGELSVQGNRVFFTEGQMLHIIDVSDPTAPTQVHEYDLPVFHNSDSVGIAGNFAYFGLRFDPFVNPDSRIEEVRVLDRGVLSSANLAQSVDFAAPPYPVEALRMTPTASGVISWRYSPDGGADFYPRTADGSWENGLSTATGMRWQATLQLMAGQPDPVCTELAVDWRFDRPLISSIIDVPADQGGELNLSFLSSGYELVGVPPVTAYAVYRQSTAGWDSVATVAPSTADTHALTVPTLNDSTLWDGAVPTSFFVRVWLADGTHIDSPADSASSIDNLAPSSPNGLRVDYYGDRSNILHWNFVSDPDVIFYRIHRGTTEIFPVSGATAVDSVSVDPRWADPDYKGWDVYYAVTAVDSAGNESAAAYPEKVTAIEPSTLPKRWVLGQNIPNPFNPTTVISFIAPESGGRATLALYDVSGRHVATLLESRVSGGLHRIRWNGTDDAGERVSSGVYFYRLRTPAGEFTRKMTLVE